MGYDLYEYTAVKFITSQEFYSNYFKHARIYSTKYNIKRAIKIMLASEIIIGLLTKHLIKGMENLFKE